MDAILTHYPLSRDFQVRLASLVSRDAITVRVGELQRLPVIQIFRYLRSINVDRLLLPIEDENGAVLLPILQLVATIVPARSVYLVARDLSLRRTSRLDAVGCALRVLHASFASRFAVIRARQEIRSLLAEERGVGVRHVGCDVLYLNANLWFGVQAGGSVGHISGVVNALVKQGFGVSFVSAGGPLMVRGAQYTELKPPEQFGFPPELNHYRFHFRVLEQLRTAVSRQRFDFIYQRLSIANYSGVILSRRLRVPLVLEYNGSEAWIAKNWGRPLREQVLAEQIEEVNLRHAHLVVTISDVLKDELLSRGVAPERIVSYPNCIDPELFDPSRFASQDIANLRQRHGIAADAVVITFIGTFGQWHGAEVLARAINQLVTDDERWIRENRVHFLLVGDGVKMSEVRTVLGVHAQGPHVTLAGLVPQREAPLYLAASDIVVSPHVPNADGSRFFGSPTKLFEYMAMGKAILASDLDQIGDVLANSIRIEVPENEERARARKRVALLLPPGDAVFLAAGIRVLIEQPGMRSVISENARKLALERYTWGKHVDCILEGLSRVCA